MNWPTAEAYHITSMAFSSEEGGHAVLGVGRSNGHLALWSTFEHEPRFEAQQPNPIASISWKPITTKRSSQREGSLIDYVVETEELLVGDETGKVYYYVIEWPDQQDRLSGEWHGSMKLLARISIHTQQICGISWSLDGSWFATGGNDNTCCLFQVGKILRQHAEAVGQTAEQYYMDEDGARRHMAIPGRGGTIAIAIGEEKHKWIHGAAVKAIAFCPWQKGLLATGGGSNDRCIHFYHVVSGACLATITVAAQVTSLIWSTTRREIAATFGYTQPEHPYRIAVFSWPDCRQVVAIPWSTDSRALYAVPYPMGSNEANERISSGEGGLWTTRSAEEGCIIVACSDQSIKFHEVWSDGCKTVGGRMGLLGGSAILESLEGIDKEGAEVIR
jgi:meiosis-specific APC/C activator protein AMA1